MFFVVVAGIQIHKVKRQWGLAQAVANVKNIAGCMSQSLKLIFDYVRVDRVLNIYNYNFNLLLVILYVLIITTY